MRRKNHASRIRYQPILITVFAVLLVAGVSYYVFNSQKHANLNIIPSSTVSPKASTSNSLNKNSAKQSTPTTAGNTVVENSSTQKTASSTSSNSTLTAPTGTFVSNHNPGVGSPTTEESICNTTPGASCYIEFEMGNVVKTLSTQTVGSSGTVYWSWDATTLTQGSWNVSAVATLNGQTKTSNDVTPLVIQS